MNYRRRATNTSVQGDWLLSQTLSKNDFSTRTYDDGSVIVLQVRPNRRTDDATVNTVVDHAFDARNWVSVSGLFSRERVPDNGDNPYFLNGLDNRYRLRQSLEDEAKYTAFASAVVTHKFVPPGLALAFTGNYSFHRDDEKYSLPNTLTVFTGRDSFALLADEHVVDLNADYMNPSRRARGSRLQGAVPLDSGR
jgi:hypothetical protein